MISTQKTETVLIVLDGEEVEVPAGMNLVDAAALFQKEIPHYCYHPQLSVAGNCRMCLIEMGPGVPPSIISGQIVAQEIDKQLKKAS